MTPKIEELQKILKKIDRKIINIGFIFFLVAELIIYLLLNINFSNDFDFMNELYKSLGLIILGVYCVIVLISNIASYYIKKVISELFIEKNI